VRTPGKIPHFGGYAERDAAVGCPGRKQRGDGSPVERNINEAKSGLDGDGYVGLARRGGVALAATIDGNNNDNHIRGTNGDDQINGRGGDDVLLGLRGSDSMYGGNGRDAVLGSNEFGPLHGDKTLDGGRDGDFVGGGRGADSMSGGGGRDALVDGPLREQAKDALSGEAGDDAIISNNRPAATDVVDCGSGFDRALVDSEDITSGCERTYIRDAKFFRAISDYNYFAPLDLLS